LQQKGTQFVDAISSQQLNLTILGENKIDYSPPAELALKLKNTQLTAKSTSGLPVSYATSTNEICNLSGISLILLKLGTCTITVSQPGDAFTEAAESLTFNISITGARVSEDQPDSLIGFQIKAIYVVPSDGLDNKYDVNGFLAAALTEGNRELKNEIGYELQIDSIDNEYDIQFFRSSYPSSHFLNASSVGDDLMRELKMVDKLGQNRKNYVFFIDVDGFKYDAACGYAARPGFYSVVAVGTPRDSKAGSCVGKSRQLTNYVSHTWVHEVFHNFGVEHGYDDACDLMRGSNSGRCDGNWRIDKDRNRYVNSNKQGVNVLSLRVWKGYTSDQNLRASCILGYSYLPRSDGMRYASCPTGTEVIGALTYCWSSIRSAELQVYRDQRWVSLGQGKVFNQPWGSDIDWKCDNSSYVAPWMQLTVTTPGIQRYRWMVNDREAEQFQIIWQN
jgi:predicted Zn-dependent protease